MFEILYNIYKLRNDINEFFICYQATSAIDFCLVAFSVGVASYKFFHFICYSSTYEYKGIISYKVSDEDRQYSLVKKIGYVLFFVFMMYEIYCFVI